MAGQARQLLLLRRLNNLKACHQVFAEAQVSSPWVWLLLLAFLALYPVSMGISLLTLPPTGTSGGWGLVIILVTAALLAGAKLFFDRRKEGIVAGAKKHLTKSIDRLCDEFPQEAACWGGSDALWEAQRVRDMIQVVSAKMAAEQPALLQPHRGQVVYALGILGWFLPLLGIVAWILGNSDLEAMNAGKMDRSGYSQTDSGRTLGKAACLLYGALIGIALLVRTNH